ncbi:hypothetical protein BBOU_1692 [Bifidobacterium boum]|uniref:Uncharacterized protein n=1 Tax=Bifidobacterium boum TaxID=78343 RepID=A0A086ZFC6_9BIFI|nr:hypothetical protein BBOU_1692 [Bifidobacterium boum]
MIGVRVSVVMSLSASLPRSFGAQRALACGRRRGRRVQRPLPRSGRIVIVCIMKTTHDSSMPGSWVVCTPVGAMWTEDVRQAGRRSACSQYGRLSCERQ